jgi:putative glutamine amidotransferase
VLRAADGLAVLVTPGESPADELSMRLDGLILTGGGDIDPSTFGGAAHEQNYSVSLERDHFEIELVGGALAAGLPTLAICRGMQVLNVALGGDLHSHLPDVVGEAVTHRASQTEAALHPVRIEAGSALAQQLGSGALEAVPSWHHQGVDRLGRGLRPVAWAPDQVVEALELAGEPQVSAVQWHPELAGDGGEGRGLFAALVERAAAYAKSRA